MNLHQHRFCRYVLGNSVWPTKTLPFVLAIFVFAACSLFPGKPDGAVKFSEVAAPAGVAFQHFRDDVFFNIGGGGAAADYNNDGLLDIYVTNSKGANALYRNNGDGTFDDVSNAAGVEDPTGRSNAAGWGDYNNDGHIDLFVSNFGTSKLFRNDGDGTFTEVTVEAGVKDPNSQHRTTGVAWGDYDQDGNLDLLIVRWLTEDDPMVMVTREFETLVRSLALYHNNGDGTFTDLRSMLGDPRDYPSKVKGAGFKPSFVDYDSDGDPDIYVVNDFGQDNYHNVLWRNDGPNRNDNRFGDDGWIFTDVSADSGADAAISGMSLAVGDYDNDSDLDFYMTNMGASEFLENQGDGTFLNVTQQTGAGRGQLPGDPVEDGSVGWGSAFGDFNNDGFLDLYYVAGGLDESQPNALFINDGNGAFEDISSTSGTDDMGVGRDVICGDFDNDGRPDLFVVNVGSEDGSPGIARLFQNVSNTGNHWLRVKLVGAASNRDAIGARVTVTANGSAQVREMGSSQSQMSHSVLPVHFGLGNSSQVEKVEIRWPSGIVETLSDVAVDKILTITEPAK